MPNPTAAMLVIGDEILSGRTRDANMHHLAAALTEIGTDLKEVRIVSDDAPAIVAAVQALSAGFTHVFTSGGIGPTHDDITADCIAEAFGAAIDVRDDARALLKAHYDRNGMELNTARLRMARIPDGASLIDNPVSIAPGFKLENVHVMAGVPSVFQAMVATVLPTLVGGAPLLSRSLRVMRGEGDIAGPLGEFAQAIPICHLGLTLSKKMGFMVQTSLCAEQMPRSLILLWKPCPRFLPRDPAFYKKLYAVIDGTWPAAAKQALGPWTVRMDDSGSSRVSAATAEAPFTADDIPEAEASMREAGQRPLFMIREGEEDIDRMLAARGYLIKDPVNMYAAPVDQIATQRPPPVTTFEVWPPLAVQTEVWAAGGINKGRIDVMDRARQPKTTLLGRLNDRAAGTVYVGIAGDCAMIHALEVAQDHRRQGLAAYLTRSSAFWAQTKGAAFLTLVTTQANDAANALYTSLGMTLVGHYHYRTLPE